ncbi:MAG: ABC transporter substrate-binding protein [Acidimicrobiia bacterium]|nr:ABC transporter substrate-binding protein [Acidimicrobiia bacterium]
MTAIPNGRKKPGRQGAEGGRTVQRSPLLALLLALVLVLAACGSGDDTADDTTADDTTTETTAASDSGDTGGDDDTATTEAGDEPDERGTTLRYSYPQEPPNWNYWETGLTAVSGPLLENVWETIVRLEADGTPVPLLAEAWDVSDDGLSVTLNLREGVVFHDGSDMTSADVVYSLNKNAESGVSRASAPLSVVESVTAVDDYTVEISLSQASIPFIAGLANRAGIVVPENFFEENDAATTVIGTGPYSFGEYRIDQDVTLNRFDDYWGEQPYFETVIQRFIPDETAALNALLGGELDMVASVIGEGMDRVSSIADDPNFTLTLVPGTEVSYWALNPAVEAFQDIRVRQAIQYGHNRQSHIDAATAGTATYTCNMAVPAGVPWDDDYCPYDYDPDRAMELLEEAGATDLVLDFPFANVAWHTVMAQIFQAEMAEIGITIELRSQDLATWLDQTNTQGQYEVFQITSGASLDQYRCGRGRQPFGPDYQAEYCDEEMDALIDALDGILDYDEYTEAQTALHHYVADQGWIFATKKPNVPQLTRSDLVGFREHRFPEPHVYVGGLHWDN